MFHPNIQPVAGEVKDGAAYGPIGRQPRVSTFPLIDDIDKIRFFKNPTAKEYT